MRLSDLTLQNFRSYSKQTFEFAKNTTVFVGPNTVGKTNILEALFLLATGKSIRAEKDSEMVRWGKELSVVSCKLLVKNEEEKLEIRLTTGEVGGQRTPIKKFLVNGVPRRMVDFAGKLKAVLFWPEDLDLVIGSPSLRRRYLDFVLLQTDWEYRRSLNSYERAIRQRNRLLERIRDGEASRNQLLFWNQLLIKDGTYLTDAREKYIAAVNNSAKPFGQFKIVYDHSVISEARLAQYADAEVASAVTLVGPHRDDLKFLDKGRDVAKYGSRGEQRLMVLWLKLNELDYIEKTTGERPLLLLDDIFSELDHEHREEVLKVVGKQQTIMTTTDIHFLPERLLKVGEVVKLT